jgi:hypothetical protein
VLGVELVDTLGVHEAAEDAGAVGLVDTFGIAAASHRSRVASPICDFFEDIALLEERGHLSRKDVWEDWNRTVEFWWSVLAPAVHERRSLYPGDFEGFERLNKLMQELDRKAGRVNEFGPATRSKILDDLVEGLSASLRLELESRTGVMPDLQTTGSPPSVSKTDMSAEGADGQVYGG